jgi:hypothetical protein
MELRTAPWGWTRALPFGLVLRWTHPKTHEGASRGWSLTLYRPMKD